MPEPKNKNQVVGKLKGMRDIRGDDYYQMQGMFEKAQEVAVYYGFTPIETPVLERADIYEKSLGEVTDIVEKEMYKFNIKGSDTVAMRPEYTAGVVRSYIENGMIAEPQPLMLYSYGSTFRHEKPQFGRYREFKQFNLEILGSPKAVSDAIIIRTVYDILEEFGFKDVVIDINSMGDKETRNTYIKELTNYYKKKIDKLCDECKNRIKTNPLRLLDCKNELCQEHKEKAPQSITFLSTDARKHFKEVLQYLEEMEIPYRVNPSLVRGQDYYMRTVFEFVQDLTDENGEIKNITVCGGGRYDLSKNFGFKKDIPSVGAGMSFERILISDQCENMCPKIMRPAKIYFIQIGQEAKLKSLNILETLRKAKIPVMQNITKDSLGQQLEIAEQNNIPYCVIFGQKEAMSNTIIIRDMKKGSQEIISLNDICEYIKKLK